MSRMKTLIAGGVFLAVGTAQSFAAGAFPISPSQRASAFALCAGAYTAVAEHAALFGGAPAVEAEDRRDMFALMLEAVTPSAVAYGMPDMQITATRVQARADLRALLSAAEFNMMPERADPAREAASARLAQCDRLLLGV